MLCVRTGVQVKHTNLTLRFVCFFYEVTIAGLVWIHWHEKQNIAAKLWVNLKLSTRFVQKLLAAHFRADRVLWPESLSDPKLSLLDLTASGLKVLFWPPLASAVGSGGPGGSGGSLSETSAGVWSKAASVGGEVRAAASAVLEGFWVGKTSGLWRSSAFVGRPSFRLHDSQQSL